jgi:hypothetical protein
MRDLGRCLGLQRGLLKLAYVRKPLAQGVLDLLHEHSPERHAMSAARQRPRRAPPIAASMPLCDPHFSIIWESALSLPPDLRPQFYEMVAVDLKRADPVTDTDVAAAIERALQALIDVQR